MKIPPDDQRAAHEQRIEEAKRKQVAPEPGKAGAHGRPVQGGAPESPESRETFPQRAKKPGQVGLANEARPGLGTRGDEPDPKSAAGAAKTLAKANTSGPESKPEATTRGYEEPRPAPREQDPDSLAHEQERSTGVSGHSSGS